MFHQTCVDPETKPVPVMVKAALLLPTFTEVGVMAVTVGTGLPTPGVWTVRVWAALGDNPGWVTVMLTEPALVRRLEGPFSETLSKTLSETSSISSDSRQSYRRSF